MEPTVSAVGSWSGGRYMRFGVAVDEDRLAAILRPDRELQTVITADVYGTGEADRLTGKALAGLPRDRFCLVGAIGHDFYTGKRAGAKGYPRFTDPALRSPDRYPDYIRFAVEQSLARLGQDRFDLLLLHNPDRIGYRSPEVWEKGLAKVREEGLADHLGVAPGPANGYVLDLIDCFERFAGLVEWAMVIYGPLEPWPAELALAAAARHGLKVITRVIDHGGLLFGDVDPEERFPAGDHRSFRPRGWVAAGLAKLEALQPYANRHRLTLFQLGAAFNLAHPAVRTVVPTLIQEHGPEARPIEEKRAELAALGRLAAEGRLKLSPAEVEEIRRIGDNSGCMELKGGSPEHHGSPLPDRWEVDNELRAVASRYGIDPERQLVRVA